MHTRNRLSIVHVVERPEALQGKIFASEDDAILPDIVQIKEEFYFRLMRGMFTIR